MNLNEDLYKEIILDHYKSKKNRKRLPDAARHLEAANPSCGDDIDLYLEVENGKIQDAAFEGMGCSICLASADMMCDAFRGKTLAEANSLIDKFKGMLTRNEVPEFPDEAADLEAMQGVAKFPLRIKCALLAWTTAHQLVAEENKSEAEKSS
ncbi:MAG TPA: SUF system NifU family Fe-S cluster assembly protein [Spirochaetia bacterium]|nr:SUF system NifU family Fe-S cluster assembly protein [Spirochaetia bacterium]